MKLVCVASLLLAGCGLYFGSEHDPADAGASDPLPDAYIPPADLYQLAPVASVAAEGEIRGVDADQTGNLWIAYTDDKTVSVVHWDPATRERLVTFTYDGPSEFVSGLAVVGDTLWLSYEPQTQDAVTRVLSASTGEVLATLGATGYDLAAMGPGQVALSDRDIEIVDSSSGGELASFASTTVIDPTDMGGISFSGTQQGIAWRPGEVWLASWYLPLEVHSETGALLGTIDLPDIRSESAWPTTHLAFDRGQLLVGRQGTLTWYAVR